MIYNNKTQLKPNGCFLKISKFNGENQPNGQLHQRRGKNTKIKLISLPKIIKSIDKFLTYPCFCYTSNKMMPTYTSTGI